ncbi:hypothetical protein MLD38_009501 [Melastoma candidum]|uniref:Uncharacterized protein n=1 Tax=Melastoma candidum TaxID=119954 RepID=A0ACB9RXQ9_9MYRT|nr:hypothetical protein MLD38_009501 [Melastoma candidum]
MATADATAARAARRGGDTSFTISVVRFLTAAPGFSRGHQHSSGDEDEDNDDEDVVDEKGTNADSGTENENDSSKCSIPEAEEEKSIDKLIEDEIRELGAKSKRRFATLDSGCSGVIFIQMQRQTGDPGPKEIVQHIMTSAASKRKHTSRFILRILPVELACYASEEEISKAIKPLVSTFLTETEPPSMYVIKNLHILDFCLNYGGPNKVGLNNPDKSVMVRIVKTTCLIEVVEKYKELAKYNLRQLTSQKT